MVKLSASGVPCYASCKRECCRIALHNLYSAQQSSVPTLQLARNEQNQIKPQKMKDVDSWHFSKSDRQLLTLVQTVDCWKSLIFIFF
ncbi:hypothetical protein [Nostoc sp.]|uniref:hypothetical protein n=1 Tax=Nostoc sp. TaxID=1180 RepID=UPI002FF61DA0